MSVFCEVSLLHHLCKAYTWVCFNSYLLSDINRIEKVQCWSARFVHNDFSKISSITSMLNKAIPIWSYVAWAWPTHFFEVSTNNEIHVITHDYHVYTRTWHLSLRGLACQWKRDWGRPIVRPICFLCCTGGKQPATRQPNNIKNKKWLVFSN